MTNARPRFRCATTPSSVYAKRSARISASTRCGCGWRSSRPLFFQPMATIGAYLALGVVVGLTNWFAADQPAKPRSWCRSNEHGQAMRNRGEALAIAA